MARKMSATSKLNQGLRIFFGVRPRQPAASDPGALFRAHVDLAGAGGPPARTGAGGRNHGSNLQ